MGVSLGFDLGRSDGFPTRYGDQYSPVTVDVPLAGIITAFIILGVAFLAIIPAYNSILRTILFSRVVCSLVIGGIILGELSCFFFKVSHILTFFLVLKLKKYSQNPIYVSNRWKLWPSLGKRCN